MRLRFPRRGWPAVGAAAVFGAVALLFFGAALLPGRVLLPTDIIAGRWPPWQQPTVPVAVNNFMLADAMNYIYPVKTLVAEALQEGLFPLWNPFTLGGYPLTYNTQAGIFYPATLLYLLLPPAAAVDAVIFLQLALGGIFMALFLQRLGTGWAAALWGAILFSFNGHMIVWIEWQVVHAAMIWLPLQLWFIERVRSRFEPRNGPHRWLHIWGEICGLALAFSLPWLGGHWNWAIYGSMTVVVYALFRLWPIRSGGAGGRGLRVVMAGFAFGALLAAVQVLPAFNYLSQSHRVPLPYGELVRVHGLGSRAAAWFIPRFYGSTQADNYWIQTVELTNDIEATVYLGLLPLFLGGLALAWRRDWPVRFFTIWGVLGLLWALGTPAYRLLAWLPVFNALFPGRAAVIPIFSLTVLAALALDRLLADPPPARPRPAVVLAAAVVFASVPAGFAILYWQPVRAIWPFLRPEVLRFGLILAAVTALLLLRLANRLPGRPFLILAFILLVADLWLFGRNFNTIGRIENIYPRTETENFLVDEREAESHRIITTGRMTAFFPNTSQVAGIENISGYEPGVLNRVLNYLRLAEGGEVLQSSRFVVPQAAVNSPLLDAANVKYLVTIADIWEATPVADDRQDRIDSPVPLPFRWPILMTEGGLQRVDLWLQPDEGSTGSVRLRVLSSDELVEFAHADLSLDEVDGPGWYSFFFSPFPSEWGRAFVLAAETDADGLALGGNGSIPGYVSYLLPRPGLVFEGGKTRIYLNEGYFPRAYAVPEALIVEHEGEALAVLDVHRDNLDRLVVLELEGQTLPEMPSTGGDWAAEVKVTDRGLNEVTLAAALKRPGFVVLTETYYPGWRAEIDGRPVPVYRANSIFRAVAVPAGSHEITFRFRPPDFYVGAGLSAAALIVGLGGWLFFAGRERRRSV